MRTDLILTSDWHLRESIPECRTDDFWQTLWQKVNFVAELQKKYDCPVLHGGDLFHHWKPSPMLLSWAMRYLPDWFHTIYGQHDLPQHNWDNRWRSGIHTLEEAGRLKVLENCHWGQDPGEQDHASFKINGREILVWHKMVWQGKRLWPGQTDPSATVLLKKFPEYDLILTGDNHKPFVEEYDGRLLVNPGSLTRQSAEQIDAKPRVYLYDAETNTVRPEYIPIEKDAVSRVHLEERADREDRIEAFISKFGGDWEAGMSFEQNLEKFFQSNKVLDSVKQIVWKSIETE